MRKLFVVLITACCIAAVGRAQTPEQPSSRPKDYTAHVVGYAHMDMAWLWRWEESIHDIMYNTFTNQLKLMDQFPDYTLRAGPGGGSRLHGALLPGYFQGDSRKG